MSEGLRTHVASELSKEAAIEKEKRKAREAKIHLLRLRRQKMEQCNAMSRLYKVLDTFVRSSCPSASVIAALEYAAAGHRLQSSALIGSDDAVLAVREALQSTPGDQGLRCRTFAFLQWECTCAVPV